jgi:hypothetical protein
VTFVRAAPYPVKTLQKRKTGYCQSMVVNWKKLALHLSKNGEGFKSIPHQLGSKRSQPDWLMIDGCNNQLELDRWT